MPRDRKPPLLIEYLIKQVGFKKAQRVALFMVAWDVAESAIRRDRGDENYEPTVDEYADWWKDSRAKGFRDQGLFREAFPNERTPSRLMAIAHESRVEIVALRGGRVVGFGVP